MEMLKSESESEDAIRFQKSLQELKELRSQLHYAADYCESTFANSTEKKMVVDNTKEYICKAAVTVVDHLGSVSANLDCLISKAKAFSEAELRIDTLRQRVLSCEQYAHKLALTKVKWNPTLPSYHRRYLSTSIRAVERSNEDFRDFDQKVLDKYAQISTSSADKKESGSVAAVLPVGDGISILSSRGPNPTFHFQLGTDKHRRNALLRRSLHGSEILSLIRRTKRTT
ncbi:ABI-1-like 1 putative isoform 1 [Tripterygium wilfordii]|uniref:ABI-1-like 1 putative isoform 1 n=1 Tax=Tripterygium wilfordii TaxID=458696 RepID=A0A7J7DQE4_TRIWF|nr:probable protein ABIL5 [Tripterygium wilfordii]KAF5748575.1 ABI-1-like 1 putative isoform 1 [Tripterygium wilfordii]